MPTSEKKHRGSVLWERREALRIPRSAIAKHLRCTVMAVYYWETGKRAPRYESVWADWDEFLTAEELSR